MTKCKGTPISFLRLDRYQLGELSAEEKPLIDEHLAECEACRGELAKIVEDDAKPLAALPSSTLTTLSTLTPAVASSNIFFLRRAWPVAGAFAIAAAMLLFLSKPADVPSEGVRVKGDGVSFGLVRDDEAAFEEGGGSFRDGDRFKVVVTCAPYSRTHADVVVWENGTPSFPLAAEDVACGNRVPLPGAFRVTGQTSMIVCLLTSDAGQIDREAIRSAGPGGSSNASCKVLTPSP